MQATVYSFEDLTRRKRASQTHPAEGSPGAHQFAAQLEALLKRLADLRLRISLARLPLVGRSGDAVGLGRAIAENIQDPCALAGQTVDGSVVAVFLGPRGGASPVGDEEMSERINGRFQEALRATDTDGKHLIGGLTVAHCWSDEIFDVPSLVLDLASALSRIEAVSANDTSRRQPA